jgi:hypothetical protein
MFIPTVPWILCCCCGVVSVVVVLVLVVNLPVLYGPEPAGNPLEAIPEKKKSS